MWKVLQICLLIVLPLAWGLLVEHVVERWRRKRRPGGRRTDWPQDWVI